MRHQVLKMLLDGTYTVIFDDDAKRYTIYRKAQGHQHIEERYDDFLSCLCYLKDIVPSGCTHRFGGKR